MFSKVFSGGILGVEGYLVSVEADVGNGLPGFTMVGYLASEVKEAQERVRTALKNSGFSLPPKKITVNLSPADIRKGGTAFDLPIAVAVLASYGIVNPSRLDDTVFAGELGLDGRIKPVHGVLSIVSAAAAAGIRRCFLPCENTQEGAVIENIEVIGVKDVEDLIHLLNNPGELATRICPVFKYPAEADISYDMDYSEVNGCLLLRRATEIAVAGRHNILYIGPAGTGKTMVAKRIPTIMPMLSREENIEISKIYSICGMLPPSSPLLFRRPFRNPHHTVSPAALTGGGRIPKPGEISLASRGVLFLDELPEFDQHTLEVLRQPLEEFQITVSRVSGICRFPAHVMLTAAMNPCSCGYYPDRNKCHCSEVQVKKYLEKISKPLLDRIDICVEAAPILYEELQSEKKNEDSATIRKRVEKVHLIQRERFRGCSIFFNSEMNGGEVRRFCPLKREDEAFMKQIYQAMGLSARGYHKILKVARTIADLEGRMQIERCDLAEAVGYRGLEDKYWGKTREE